MDIKTKALIGIDPDTDKSGFSLYAEKKIMTLQCYDLVDLMNELHLHNELYDLTVHMEAGWLVKGIWHKGGNGAAVRVGANHEIGRQIEKFCIKQEIKCKLILPKGYSSYKHEYFCIMTGWPVKMLTNSETRVAGMLVYGY